MSISVSPEKIVAANQATVDTAFALANASLNSIEKIVSLNFSTAREHIAGHFEHASSLLATTRSLQDAHALQSAQAQAQLEKLQTWSRGVYDIASETRESLLGLLEARHAELNQSIGALLDRYGNSSGNSKAAVAVARSAISAANSAYENVNRTARQVADIAEASVDAATSATARAIGASASQSRQKAA